MKNPVQIVNLQSIIPEQLAGKRLDKALSEVFPDYSRARLQDWLRQGRVLLNGQSGHQPDERVLGGETVSIQAEVVNQEQWVPENLDLNIIYEDEALLVINKPVGLVVHPAAGNYSGTLVNALLHYLPSLAQLPRAGLVHRLDKDTSGLLVVAKTLSAHHALIQQLQQRQVAREYQAIVKGNLLSGGTIDQPIARHPQFRKKMTVIEGGKTAITHFRVVEHFADFTRVKVNLETGRTHQIRVHMAFIHHPIIGDAVYGGRLQLPKNASSLLRETLRNFTRQALHAQRLALTHPETHQACEWSVPLADDMQHLITVLRAETDSIE